MEEKEILEIHADLKTGMKFEEIAKKHDIHYQTVSRINTGIHKSYRLPNIEYPIMNYKNKPTRIYTEEEVGKYKIKKEKIIEVVGLLREYKNYSAVADITGIQPAKISYIDKGQIGYKLDDLNYPILQTKEERNAEILDYYYNKGWSIREIADHYGLQFSTITYILKNSK